MRLMIAGMLTLTACLSGPAPASEAPARASRPAASAVPGGTRASRIAQIFQRIVAASGTRDWESLRAAFPGARWQPRGLLPPPNPGGVQQLQSGIIILAGARYEILFNGSRSAVETITFNGPEGNLVEQADILRALDGLGVAHRRLGCNGSSETVFQLTANGQSAQLDDMLNSGALVQTSNYYTFNLAQPMATADLDQNCE
jgi:hypothetical protein